MGIEWMLVNKVPYQWLCMEESFGIVILVGL